jgi:N-acetylmuramic acid 6-phosphate etherase
MTTAGPLHPDPLGSLATEAVDPRFARLDEAAVADLVHLMNEADAEVPRAVRAAFGTLIPAVEAVSERMQRGGRLVYVGAGTPGRIGILDASECPPTFSTPPELVHAVIAGGPQAVFRAQEGAEDDPDGGRSAIDELGLGGDDSVIGIAASGRTPFVLGAISRAREVGALTVGLSCNEGTALSAAADHGIEVLVGPEVLAGSTRLKAGTAQKLVLNMFSTIAMVRLGKTYGNLMVDLNASNAKLRSRAVRLVSAVTGAGAAEARTALDATGMRVAPAAVMIHHGTDPAQADALLERNGGRLRAVLEVQP